MIACDAAHSESCLDEDCPWKFVFMLFVEDRPFRLYAKCKEDRELWIKQLSDLISKKNEIQSKYEKNQNFSTLKLKQNLPFEDPTQSLSKTF